MAPVAVYLGWGTETTLLSHCREFPDLFPCVPSQSRLDFMSQRALHLLAEHTELTVFSDKGYLSTGMVFQ